MILANGATPLQAHIDLTPEPGMVAHRGFVLAQRGNKFITWECGKEADDEVWDCSTGHYFQDIDQAKYDFGLRVYRALTTKANDAVRRAVDQRARELLTS